MLVQPADHSSIVAASGPPQYVPAVQLEQSKQQLAALQSHVNKPWTSTRASTQMQLKFDYTFKAE